MRVSDLVPWRNQLPVRRSGEGDTFDAMRREMNQVFSDFFQGLESDGGEGVFNPRVNVAETDEQIEATVELPGLAEEDVDLTLTRDGLVVKGEKRVEKEEEGKNYYRRERAYGSFQRLIPLPPDLVDRERVSAEFDRGILTVTMPKREQTRPAARKITVQSG